MSLRRFRRGILAEQARVKGAGGLLGVGILVVGVLLGLAGGGGIAVAYWSLQGTATGPGSLRSGTLDLTAGPSTGAEQLVGAGGTWTITGLGLTDAAPGSSVARSFVLRSASSTSLHVTIRISSASNALSPALLASSTTGGAASNTTSGGLAQGACTGTPAATSVPVSTTSAELLPATPLAATGTVSVCVLLRLAPNAAASLQNSSSGAITLTLSAVQDPP